MMKAFLEIAGSVRLGTVDEYRGGNWYDAGIVSIPSLNERWRSQYGWLEQDELRVEILSGGYSDSQIKGWLGQSIKLELPDRVIQRTIQGVIRRPGTLEISGRGVSWESLSATYPKRTYTADEFPELSPADEGTLITDVNGLCYRVTLPLLAHGARSGPWIYGVCEYRGGRPKIPALYRGGRYIGADDGTGAIRDSSGNVIATATTYNNVACLSFAQEQVDFSGNFYQIEADVDQYQRTTISNAAVELERLLGIAGFGVNRASFNTAISNAYALSMRYHMAYGRSRARTIQAYVEELLYALRSNVYLNDIGEVVIVQDVSRPISVSMDESFDPIETTLFSEQEIPKSIGISYLYRPAFGGGDELRHTLSRDIDVGTAESEADVQAPWFSAHAQADNWLGYMTQRQKYNATAKITTTISGLTLGQRISIQNSPLWQGARDWTIEAIDHDAGVYRCELREYSEAVYSYSLTPAPDDAVGYEPDFSGTPPGTPGVPFRHASGSVQDGDGNTKAWIEIRATAPAGENWAQIWFALESQQTNALQMQQGRLVSGTTYSARFENLTPGVVYTALAWAVNQFGLEGPASSADLIQPAPGDTVAPTAPASISVTQGSGKALQISWESVDAADLNEYELQRNGAAFWKGLATKKTDTTVSYGNTYTYRVRAVDKSGNASGWRISDPFVVAKTVGDKDIDPNDPIESDNIGPALYAKSFWTNVQDADFRVGLNGIANEFQSYTAGKKDCSLGLINSSAFPDQTILEIGRLNDNFAPISIVAVGNNENCTNYLYNEHPTGAALLAYSSAYFAIQAGGIVSVNPIRSYDRIEIGPTGQVRLSQVDNVLFCNRPATFGGRLEGDIVSAKGRVRVGYEANGVQLERAGNALRVYSPTGQWFEMSAISSGAIRFRTANGKYFDLTP